MVPVSMKSQSFEPEGSYIDDILVGCRLCVLFRYSTGNDIRIQR